MNSVLGAFEPDSDGSVGRRALAKLVGGLVLAALLVNAFVTSPQLFVDQAVSGLVRGMILVLIALGLAIILGLLGIVNFAHGALFMAGAYLTFQVMALWGLPFWLALAVVPILVGIVGIAIERGVLRFLYDENPLVGLLATFGIAMMLDEATRAVWGGSPKSVDVPALFSTNVDLVITSVTGMRLFTVVVSAITVVGVYLLIERTSFGLSVRAGVADREMAEFVGVNIPRRFTLMFFLGAAIAGLGGLLHGARVGMDTGLDDQFIILAFIVVVVGGVGSLFGSVVAGLVIGEAEFLTDLVIEALLVRIGPLVEGLADATGIAAVTIDPGAFPSVSGLVPYLVMILVLLTMPRGLFGREGFME